MPGGSDLCRGQRAGAVAALHAHERGTLRGDQGGRRWPHHREARPQGRPRVQEKSLSQTAPGSRAASAGPGVLLIQLGTPDAPTPQALRPYLRQFLGDPRVIEGPPWYWPLIFQLI